MRRDVFIDNDSGGFSVLAAEAVDAIIEDDRSDDLRFVTEHKVLLLELYGDDSMPVRIVVDEPLRADEEAQWLARASWQIDTSDGRMLVMGGFDPDVLSSWKEDSDGDGDGGGVAAFSAAPGRWRVDVYAHVGSMNGRALLNEAETKPGAAFRRSHPGRAFPLWLARLLEFSGDDDPGFGELWENIPASVAAGKLAVDTDGPDAIGFLVHVTPDNGAVLSPPEDGWFSRTNGARDLATFPIGLASETPDRGLRHFRDRLLGRRAPAPELPVAGEVVGIIESWTGDTLKPVEGGGVAIAPSEVFLLHWMAAFTTDSTPRFELFIEPNGEWTAPAPTSEYGVISKGRGVTAIGPVRGSRGWQIWWAAKDVATALPSIPDGSTIDMATAPRLDDDADLDPAVGRGLYSGTTRGGMWQITDASPRILRETLEQALTFARDVALHGRLTVRRGAEREAFDSVAEIFSAEEGSLVWDGDVLHLAEPDERMLLLLASPVFRVRFAAQWPMD